MNSAQIIELAERIRNSMDYDAGVRMLMFYGIPYSSIKAMDREEVMKWGTATFKREPAERETCECCGQPLPDDE